MPRPVWKGYLSFGLVSIPVNAITVEDSKELHFHMLDSRDKSRVRYQRINENTGKVVPWEMIVKGYEYDKDDYVLLDDEDFQSASPEAYKSIEIEEFVNLDEVKKVYLDKPYFLLPDGKNHKAYVLLREALKKTNKAGVAKVIIRTKEHLSLIFPQENAILLYLLRFEQELRDEQDLNFPSDALKNYKIVEREVKMATDLINDMTNKWDPSKYHDEYSEALMKWIEKKATSKTGLKPKKSTQTRQTSDVVDFISLLKKSLKNKKPGSDHKTSGRKKNS